MNTVKIKNNIPFYVHEANNTIRQVCDKHSHLIDLDTVTSFPITFKLEFPYGDVTGVLATIDAIHTDLSKAKVGTTRIVIEPTEVTWTVLPNDPSIPEFHDKRTDK